MIERRHKHLRRKVKAAPTLSLSQLLQKSAELTRKFEHQASELREKVQETEQGEQSEQADAQPDDGESSFLETGVGKPVVAEEGMKAMEAVTEDILRFTDHMRKLGNEASLFYRK